MKKKAQDEQGITQEIAAPEPPGLKTEPEKPLDAESTHPERTPLPVTRKILEKSADTPADGGPEIIDVPVDKFFLPGNTHAHQENIHVQGANIFNNGGLTLIAEIPVVIPDDIQIGQPFRETPDQGFQYFGPAAEKVDPVPVTDAEPGELRGKIPGIDTLRQPRFRESRSPYHPLAVGVYDFRFIHYLRVPRIFQIVEDAVGVDVGDLAGTPVSDQIFDSR